MKTKNIFKKPISFFALVVFSNLLFASFAFGSVTGNENCIECISECEGIRFFLSVIAVIFLALILWTISPVGILFFLSAKTLLSKSSSGFKRKLAWMARGVAFLTWISVMFLLFIIYIDSVSYKVFDLGGDILNLAIISGLAFFVVMILVIFFEKTICCYDSKNKSNNKANSNDSNNKTIPKKNKKLDDSVKFAGIEFGGTKRKVKRKIKEDLKKIINKEIDKRL